MNPEDITITPFSATVLEGEPFCFDKLAAQDVHSSLRITHVSYLPPISMEALEEYYRSHPEAARPVSVKGEVAHRHHSSSTSVPSSHSSYPLTYAVAEVEDLSFGNELKRTVIGCFPLDLRRLPPSATSAKASNSGSSTAVSSVVAGSAEGNSTALLTFPHGLQLLAPVDTDILRDINIQLDCDGFVKLSMRGPGSIYFYGEQRSLLIPEWKNHHFFKVDADDEEKEADSDDLDDDELAEMFRLAR